MTVIKIAANKIGGELTARARKTPAELTKAMTRTAHRGRAMLARRTPKDLGQAKAGWRVSKPIRSAGGARVDLYNDAPYVGILELGARPHGMSLEGRMAIFEWVLRNIPPSPVQGPVQHRREKSGGRSGMNKRHAEAGGVDAEAMDITNAIVRKIRQKGQKGKFFVLKSMEEMNRDFGANLDKQITAYAKRRAKRKGGA